MHAMPNPVIEFPESLPVSAMREEIVAALSANQVIIVCGETGSGKTTQLPKIALAMGRGKRALAQDGWGKPAYAPGQGKLIGHTQPRRIAASSVAKRIAEELKTPLGEVVGFKVRFQDRLSRDASVKLMTDGILLAETQTDPLLKAYDTIILDEAHERSLNIDFLLGYLRQILPRRPDLKIVVTSATIDAQRFADHFGSRNGPAPIIMVSGRMFPVEQRYRPFEESREYDLNNAIADGVDELWSDVYTSGDILVFLPGEREIREAADHLRKHLSHQPVMRNAEVLPLFARLSQAEQDRIFDGTAAGVLCWPPMSRKHRSPCPAFATWSTRVTRASSATATATRSSSCGWRKSRVPPPRSEPGAAAAWRTASASGSTTKTISRRAPSTPTRKCCARRLPP